MADQTIPPGDGLQQELPIAKNQMPVNIEDEMRRSYLDYSMSVIIGRRAARRAGRAEAGAAADSLRHV